MFERFIERRAEEALLNDPFGLLRRLAGYC